MAFSPSSSSSARRDNNSPPRSSTPSTVNRDTALANSLNRLSVNSPSATALPPSPASSSRSLGQQNYVSPSNGPRQARSPLHRSPSSMSDARSATPTLLRKASMNSMQGVGGVTPSRSSSSRRSSSALLNASPVPLTKSRLSSMEDTRPPAPRHTAASIASAHFRSELGIHENEAERPADTIVILHDSCYGHRYSRPRTSRSALSTIVERPERIQASILGVSAAYVRLGDRHVEGQYPLSPGSDASAIPTIPFRIRKTTRKLPLSSPAVTNVHGPKWMEELKFMCNSAESKLAMNGKELTRPDMARSPDQDTPSKFHEGDLYLCAESLDAMEGALGAVCEGVDAVFKGSETRQGPHRTFVAIRPPGHHCSATYPSGFCWLNNVHVGIGHAALTHGLTHAAIIDFDLHHGDGSQSIAWDHNTRAKSAAKNAAPWKKTSIGYFSLHDINSYPCEMGDEEKVKNASLCIENAHGQNIWNVHLQPWRSEAEFWELYETKYSVLLEKARNYLRAQTERLRALPNLPKPKGAIFLSAGFDASEWESSGMQRHKVNVPTEFYARLTRDVVKLAAEEGCAVEGRVISVLEGGYSDRALCTGVFSHLSGLAGGDPITIKTEKDHTGLGYEMGQKIGMFDGIMSPEKPVFAGTHPYDPVWWSLQKLEQLDAVMNPTAPTPEPKKPRDITPPTYSSPTQSFTAKIVDPTKFLRSASSMSVIGNGSPRAVSRAPTPPPPEVHWTVATHELSKLLIPTDRQTYSCKPEDLSAEATRARRDRQSILTPPISEAPPAASISNTRMALRERKPAKTYESVEEDDKKPKANRRKTVVGAAVLAAEKAISRSSTPKPDLPSYTQPTGQSSRRLSVASNAGSVISEAPSTRPTRAPTNGYSTLPHRPVSSQSVRPESSMSSRGPSIPSVVVKKTRAPAQPRSDAPKTSRIRKKSPLGSTEVPPESYARSSNGAPPNSKDVPAQASDIESLTDGMKKIKINLTTKAQREAKEEPKVAAKAPAAKAHKSAVSKSVKPRQPEKKAPELAPESSEPPVVNETPPQPSTPQALPPSLPAHLQDATQVPLPASSPLGPGQGTSASGPSNSETNTDVFIPYQPEGPPASTIAQPTEPLRWLPPNTSTPAATPGPTPIKRADLPVFTATSTIPFNTNQHASNGGPQKSETSGPAKQPEYDASIWEIPDTPRK